MGNPISKSEIRFKNRFFHFSGLPIPFEIHLFSIAAYEVKGKWVGEWWIHGSSCQAVLSAVLHTHSGLVIVLWYFYAVLGCEMFYGLLSEANDEEKQFVGASSGE